MEPMRILFISIEGNTRNFVNNLTAYAQKMHQHDPAHPLVESVEISDQTDFAQETKPFFVTVPTYLDGGDGIDSGVTELLTTTLGEYVGYKDNAKLCLGVFGSGNKNFNAQYCLTAKRYSRMFQVPFLADFELRGTDQDVQRIYQDMVERSAEVLTAQ
ncbi:class Ib ribonucleoside-diphosphate reductase assembly flavoprotein NrdI [Fructilactobacillus cliffordii]|uniref:class Ib ribonucleoside-diphosphate reductase assembly flavoprotein NrdI n=1 Tax=Fructilactobacillus cliffordii TaxID=2940299 RepID=UPI002093330D|nr:class Ib ribonucleoside-diphosphate reductase assembly flavoprotein NrdI [Fructilactobacillus cliffordii]USS86034.1 class Ib ribonucleoside-diphosphate reductase assembly flavoprotein NrdI [Fructilactobacillus cliffordii]